MTYKIVLAYDHSRHSDHALDVCLRDEIIRKGTDQQIIVAMVIDEDVMHTYHSLEMQEAHYAADSLAEDYAKRCKIFVADAAAIMADIVARLQNQGVNFLW